MSSLRKVNRIGIETKTVSLKVTQSIYYQIYNLIVPNHLEETK